MVCAVQVIDSLQQENCRKPDFYIMDCWNFIILSIDNQFTDNPQGSSTEYALLP